MSGVHDAQPGDVYVDDQGIVWRVVGIIREPAVVARRMVVDDDIERIGGEKRVGGVSGSMWNGWKRIYRSEA